MTAARVEVDGAVVGSIGVGLLVLLGVGEGDGTAEAESLAKKIVHLRIFEGATGKFDLGLLDVRGEMLVVSQFTLWGDCSKGRRPSFTKAAAPELAEPLYEHFVAAVGAFDVTTATGRFGASMSVHLVNDGPVTLLLDTTQNEGRPRGRPS